MCVCVCVCVCVCERESVNVVLLLINNVLTVPHHPHTTPTVFVFMEQFSFFRKQDSFCMTV